MNFGNFNLDIIKDLNTHCNWIIWNGIREHSF